jgi:4-hydroxy-2-oxoheptanedioate aldolase
MKKLNRKHSRRQPHSHLFGLKGAAVKAKLARGEPIIAVGLWYPCALIGEMLSRENVDVLVLDMEHGPWGTNNVMQLLSATAASPTAIVARPGTLDQSQVQLLFDLGIDGIMVGHCDNLATTRRAVSLSKYAPLGNRGVGPTRTGAWLRDMYGYLRKANDATLLWAQVEQRVPEDELEQMLSLPGVDALMIGQCDFASSMGRLTDWDHPDVLKAIDRTVAVARRLGKPFGVPGKKWKGQTIHLLASDIGAMQKGLKATIAEWGLSSR